MGHALRSLRIIFASRYRPFGSFYRLFLMSLAQRSLRRLQQQADPELKQASRAFDT